MTVLRLYQHHAIDALLDHWRAGSGNPLVDTAPPVIPLGRTIECAAPCRSCGNHTVIVEAGTRVHSAHLRCAQCGCGGRFLSRDQAQRLAAEAS
jgi:hypothetical protein